MRVCTRPGIGRLSRRGHIEEFEGVSRHDAPGALAPCPFAGSVVSGSSPILSPVCQYLAPSGFIPRRHCRSDTLGPLEPSPKNQSPSRDRLPGSGVQRSCSPEGPALRRRCGHAGQRPDILKLRTSPKTSLGQGKAIIRHGGDRGRNYPMGIFQGAGIVRKIPECHAHRCGALVASVPQVRPRRFILAPSTGHPRPCAEDLCCCVVGITDQFPGLSNRDPRDALPPSLCFGATRRLPEDDLLKDPRMTR